MELLLNPPASATTAPGPAPAISARPVHGLGTPSSWLTRHAALVTSVLHAAQATRGDGPPSALDVACGSGRHVHWLRTLGCRVTAIDRDAQALASLRDCAEVLVADIEGQAWPLAGRTFDVVVVTNYLWRPLLPTLVASVAPGGVLLYETFAAGNASVGRPARPEFLLQPGELLDVVRPVLRVIAFEDGCLDDPPRFVQRVAAVRPGAEAASAEPACHPLAQIAPGTS